GSQLWSVTTSGTIAQDPALADFDGDGNDEIVLATTGPNAIVVLDHLGAPVSGWPVTLPAGPAGAPLVGPLASGVPQGVLEFAGGGMFGWDSHGVGIPALPRPGRGGVALTPRGLARAGRTGLGARARTAPLLQRLRA